MATINEIQNEILTEASTADDLPVTAVLTENEQATLNSLTSTSKVSIFRLFVYVVAVAIWIRQNLWDITQKDIEERVRISRPFTKGWFIDTALNYRHGATLPESGIYDDTGLTLQQIAAMQIVARAAVEENVINGLGSLRVKVAKLENEELVKLSPTELDGFAAYMDLMTAAGISIVSTSDDADRLKVVFKIYFDPTIINANGARLDGTDDAPAVTALKAYLKDKNTGDFNGELSLDQLVDVLQAVDGFKNVFLVSAQSAYGTLSYSTAEFSDYGAINEFRRPNSGYFKLDEAESVFNYIPKN